MLTSIFLFSNCQTPVYDDDFKITYYDSKTNYGIQLADLTVNTFYNSYKNIKLVENVIKELKPKTLE